MWPSDAIWRRGFESTLAQVIACCLTAPSRYLKHCWLMISEVQWQSPEGNFISQEVPQPSITKISLGITFNWFLFKSPRGQCVKKDISPNCLNAMWTYRGLAIHTHTHAYIYIYIYILYIYHIYIYVPWNLAITNSCCSFSTVWHVQYFILKETFIISFQRFIP